MFDACSERAGMGRCIPFYMENIAPVFLGLCSSELVCGGGELRHSIRPRNSSPDLV